MTESTTYIKRSEKQKFTSRATLAALGIQFKKRKSFNP